MHINVHTYAEIIHETNLCWTTPNLCVYKTLLLIVTLLRYSFFEAQTGYEWLTLTAKLVVGRLNVACIILNRTSQNKSFERILPNSENEYKVLYIHNACLRRNNTIAHTHLSHHICSRNSRIWRWPERHNLPHQNAEAPDVWLHREDVVVQRFNCHPPVDSIRHEKLGFRESWIMLTYLFVWGLCSLLCVC